MSGGYIGVDVGGTHTDVCVAMGPKVFRGKALTDYEDFGRGVVAALSVAAENGGFGLGEMLGQTDLMINGTTVVTNAIYEMRGARVGVLVTTGFRDTFRISGGARQAVFDDHLQINPPSLVSEGDIVEVDERIESEGDELVPLDEAAVRAAAERFRADGIAAVAVCFLSSYRNPAHELRAAEIVREVAPDMFVSLSHRIFPVRGENRRWTTAVLNSFVHERARLYINSMEGRLRDAGMSGHLAFFQGLGGGISAAHVLEQPLSLLGSGPAGGAVGANELARTMGRRNVLVGDMGGTSFDTGIIVDNHVRIEKNLQIAHLKTGVNLVDIVSIGAGGGSIARIDARGVPQVGPQSASSTPGPACYGRGGTEPTTTDALVALGILDPDRYLGGRMKLHADLARKVLEERIAGPLGATAEEAAAAVYDLVVVNMANAVREVTVNHGHDPREFVFLAYGGTLPVFAVQIAKKLGITEVVIPLNSSVFCAQGLLAADYVRRYDRTVSWDVTRADGVDAVNRVLTEIRERGVADMKAEGFADHEIELQVYGDCRYSGQAHELSVPLPNRLLTADDAPAIVKEFETVYGRTYGIGSEWKRVSTQLLNVTVRASGHRATFEFPVHEPAPRAPEDMLLSHRRVFLPESERWSDIPVYDDALFGVGSEIVGPAIIDVTDTTIYVPEQVSVTRDKFYNYVLTVGSDA